MVSELLDVLTELLTRLDDPASWRTELPSTAGQIVGVRTNPATDGLSLHPLGRVVVQQGLVPLGLDRDIDRVGAFVPSNERRFRITAARVGGRTFTDFDTVHDEFPDSQFFELTEAERLSAPGMVVRQAGVGFGDDGYDSPRQPRWHQGFGAGCGLVKWGMWVNFASSAYIAMLVEVSLLGVATKTLALTANLAHSDERDLIFSGFLLFLLRLAL